MGRSEWGPQLEVSTAPAAPGAPLALSAEGVGPHEVLLRWQPPEEDNGSAVTSYCLEMAPVSRSGGAGGAAAGWSRCWTGGECGHVVAGLAAGKSYQWRLRAGNAQGWGGWGVPCTGTTKADVPGAPGHPSCSGRTASSFKVKWGMPVEEHGAAVTSYVLQLRDVGGEWRDVFHGSGLMTKVGELQPGVKYEVRVAAVNSVGQGPWSEIDSSITSLRPPKPPTRVEVVVGDPASASSSLAVASAISAAAGQLGLLVSWEPPEQEEKCAEVVGYEVEATPVPAGQTASSSSSAGGGAVLKATVSRATSVTVVGAAAGRSYGVRLRSVGAGGAGHSAWSESVVVDMPAAAAAPAHGEKSSSAAADGAGSHRGDDSALKDGSGVSKKRKGQKHKAAARDGSPAGASAGGGAGGVGGSKRGEKALVAADKQLGVARGPPKKHWVSPKYKRMAKRFGVCVLVVALLVILFTLIVETYL